MINYQELRKLISKGNTGEAMEALLKMVEEGEGRSRRFRDDLIILSSQYEEIKRKGDMGMISPEEYARERIHIDGALLSLIASIESGKEEMDIVKPVTAVQEKSTSRKVSWWLVLLALLIPLGGVGIWKIFFSNGSQVSDKPPGRDIPTILKDSAGSASSEAVLIADFEWNCKPSACTAPCEVAFVNTSQNADRFQWDFGDGKMSSQKEPTYKYLEGRSFTVTLTAIRGDHVKMVSKTLEVRAPVHVVTSGPPPPVAMFEADKLDCSAPCQVSFRNRSQHADHYAWVVDGQTASTERNFTFKSEVPGTHSIQLIATSGGRKDSYSQTVRISERPKAPVALFRAERMKGEAPCEIAFFNLSQNAEQIEWLVNSRPVGQSNNLVYKFREVGEFEVRLNVKGAGGTDTYARTIMIGKPDDRSTYPVAGFSPQPSGGVAPCRVVFSNASKNADQFSWYVNNTLVSNDRNFEYVFRTDGQYVVKLVASGNGRRDEFAKTISVDKAIALSAAFLVERNICDRLPCNILFTNRSAGAERYEWYVNDVLVSRSMNLNHAFTRTGNQIVKLVVYRGSESRTATQTVPVSLRGQGGGSVVADFSANPGTCPQAPCAVSFINRSQNATAYEWYIDSRRISTNPTLNYTFPAGRHEVKLIAINGAQRQIKAKTVQVGVGSEELKVGFRADKTTCAPPCSIYFTNDSENAESFKWYVNNTLAGTSRDFRYTFNSTGDFTVRLYGYKGSISRLKEMSVRIISSPPKQMKPLIPQNPVKPPTTKPGVVKQRAVQG